MKTHTTDHTGSDNMYIDRNKNANIINREVKPINIHSGGKFNRGPVTGQRRGAGNNGGGK
jgi:hypothetical protein